MWSRQKEYRIVFISVSVLFLLFLGYPLITLLMKAFQTSDGVSLAHFQDVLKAGDFLQALKNSFTVSGTSAVISVLIAFLMAYTINFTNTWKPLKKIISMIAGMPMLLPTITYGFAIIYSFGKQGLLTRLVGFPFFPVYGFSGILLGYVIYTLPIAFMLMNNAMKQMDKRCLLVSDLMQDSGIRQFIIIILRPLTATFAASLIQCFFLSFTDFGIPASIGGKYHVLASLLYANMLGSIPDFARGAVIAMIMLIPSIISILMMQYLHKYQVRYQQVHDTVLKQNKVRDILCSGVSLLACFILISVFAVIFFIPFIEQWPYQIHFTLDHFISVFADPQLLQVVKNTLLMAFLSAGFGTLMAYGAALVSERNRSNVWMKRILDALALITNTIPGMVIGIAYLFIFTGTPLQNTLVLLVLCNIIHFFSTPYLMMKETLNKMNASYETTARLMHDSWLQTIVRVITPNARRSLIEVFSYYFVNSAVTVSALIFIAGARTMVITTKIKELQYFAKFNEVFVLSLLLFAVNLAVRYICAAAAAKGKKK